MEPQPEQLAKIVQQMAETVIAATDTVEQLADRIDHLADQVHQQGDQISALSAAVQTLTENQTVIVGHISQLNETLDRIATSLENRIDHRS